MPMPRAAQAALAPEPVTVGAYTFKPPTLLHLAALDRMGVSMEGGRIGYDAAVSAGFLLSLPDDALADLMARTSAEIRRSAAVWASELPARDCVPLRAAVVAAVNAAFDTAVPGAEADPTTGLGAISAGSSKPPRP